METTTRQGTTLTVTLEARQRIKGGHPEPIVRFDYSSGLLCACLYLSTLQSIPAGEGFCLERDKVNRQDLSPASVATLQAALAEGVL